MKARPAADPSAVIPTGKVIVSVTTIRYEQPDGEPAWMRQSTAEGDFDTAIQQALSARLKDWALHQVVGRVLARRPDRGQRMCMEYDGFFSDVRRLLIVVQPIYSDGSTSTEDSQRIQIPGLFLDPTAA
jgi:hypothetical protein